MLCYEKQEYVFFFIFRFSCGLCDKHFKLKHHLARHKRALHSLECDKCHFSAFTEKSQLFLHQKQVHGIENNTTIVQCDKCDKTYESEMGLAIHKSVAHEKNSMREFNCGPCNIKVG